MKKDERNHAHPIYPSQKHPIKEIKQPGLHHVLAHNASIIDEGSIIRIDGTYIVDKNMISAITTDDRWVRIEYKDGDWMELILGTESTLSHTVPEIEFERSQYGFSKNGRKLGRPKKTIA